MTAFITVILFLAGLLQYEILFDTQKTYAYNQIFDLKGLTVKFTGKLYRHDVNFNNRDLFYAEQMLAHTVISAIA